MATNDDMRAAGKEIQGQLWPQKQSEFVNAAAAGLDLDAVLATDDLVRSVMTAWEAVHGGIPGPRR